MSRTIRNARHKRPWIHWGPNQPEPEGDLKPFNERHKWTQAKHAPWFCKPSKCEYCLRNKLAKFERYAQMFCDEDDDQYDSRTMQVVYRFARRDSLSIELPNDYC